MRSDPDVTVRVCFTFWVSQWQLVELLTSTVKVSVSPTWGFFWYLRSPSPTAANPHTSLTAAESMPRPTAMGIPSGAQTYLGSLR
ncbi:hypothetical protein JCM18909_1133 [Cutibacterium acnes JCM 18909]|nr:hypothetical protein JCM18909_1133 [Cutibacterium acnes JCM 18909]